MVSTCVVRTDFVVSRVIQLHPDLDCVFVNSGIQRRSVFSEPNAINMADISEEMTVISHSSMTHNVFTNYIAR